MFELPEAAAFAPLTRALSESPSIDTFDRARAALSRSHVGVDALRALAQQRDDLEGTLRGPDGLLVRIAGLAARLPELLPEPPPLLLGGRPGELTLTREQVSAMLAAVFVGALERPMRGGSWPRVDFSHLLGNASTHVQAKLACLLAYFGRVVAKPPRGSLRVVRRALDPLPDAAWWERCAAPLSPFDVYERGSIEDAEGCGQVDFANRFIGGGVLGGGCVQEEIRFSVSTELLVSLLLCAVMQDHEAIVLHGSERYSRTTGYGFGLAFAGAFDDRCVRADDGTPDTEVIAIDAIPFGRTGLAEQLRPAYILREINKAYVGFGPAAGAGATPVASGNWGCGVFGGDHQLKAVLQWLAASASGRPLRYYTFGDARVGNLVAFVDIVASRGLDVAALWRALGVAAAAEPPSPGEGLLTTVLAKL